jgi:hypothetical protein
MRDELARIQETIIQDRIAAETKKLADELNRQTRATQTLQRGIVRALKINRPYEVKKLLELTLQLAEEVFDNDRQGKDSQGS